MESTAAIERLERRVQALERRNRWTAAACAVLAAVALAGFTRAQGTVMRAERFELVNARGQVLSEWSSRADRPTLELGTLAQPHVRLGLGNNGDPGLQIVGAHGQLRMSLDLQRDIDATTLFMYGPESSFQSGISLLHVPRRGPELSMRERGRVVFRVPAGGI